METEIPPAELSGVIAKSRSRYKGNRPNQTFPVPQAPPKIHTEQLEQNKPRPSEPGPRLAHRRDDTDGGGGSIPLKATSAPRQSPRGFTENTFNHSSTGPIRKTATWPEAAPHAPLARHYRDRETPQVTQVHNPGRIQQPHLERREGECRKHVPTETNPPVHKPPMPLDGFDFPEHPVSTSRRQKSHSATPKTSTLQKKTVRLKGVNGREELKRTISAPMAVEPAEISIKPAFDAPVSAVNAGERRVRVKVDQTILSVPVTPSTTPLEIIREAGNQLQITIDPKANVLLESFKQLGLERPLRSYERVRDVMNSWDADSQNSLNVVPSPTGGKDEDLDLESVLQSQPGDTSVHIHHSNKPNTWDKKWITLRSDGQVLMPKKDGQASNICHISDFDIYIPTKRQLTKKIKPPKKYCFAVKSQQKSSMFLTTENFVHFFSTGDRELAMSWYRAVQGWRSWYLVNVMGAGQTEVADSGPQQPQQSSGGSPSLEKRRQGRPSLDDGPHPKYGFVRPQPTLQGSPPRRLPTRNHGPPPVSFPKKLSKDVSTGAPTTRRNHCPSIIQQQYLVQTESEPFVSTGLLGRTYTQRQNAHREQDRDNSQGGIYESPTNNSFSSGRKGLQRVCSQRPELKPLIDLTPKYQEPPQHQRTGRGVMPTSISAGGLLEAATNPQTAATDSFEASVGVGVQRSRTVHSQHTAKRQASGSPEKSGPAFTGGLLSSTKSGQDGSGLGRGVMTGDRAAKEPLLDMTADAQWVPGSLLDKVNSGVSGNGPVIDREKRHEVNAPVGEGF